MLAEALPGYAGAAQATGPDSGSLTVIVLSTIIRKTFAVRFILLWLLLASQSAQAAVTVRVRGASHLEGRAIPKAGEVQVRGTLKDDSGSPIAEAQVRIALPEGAAARHARPEPCPQMPPVHRAGTEVIAATDGLGRFCVRIDSARAAAVTVRFAGDDYYDASQTLRLAVDTSKRSVRLRFSPRPRYLSLDRSTHPIQVETRVEPSGALLEPLQLKLLFAAQGADPQELASASVPVGKRARFEIASERLGQPGPAALTVGFAGSDTMQPTEHSIVIERTARVSLSLAGKTLRSDPTRGLHIPVAVGSCVGAVSCGAVEALVAGKSVGIARVAAGSARVVAVFDPPPGDEVAVTLRYLPDAPWWQAGPPLRTMLPIDQPSPWRLWPWAVSVAIIALWVIRGWKRPAPAQRHRVEAPSGPPSGRASIEVLQRGPAREGWHGQVVDAHEGTPIPDARVALLVPSFGGDGIAASVVTDQDGRFSLGQFDSHTEGARLRVSARWHARLSRPLCAPGHIHINLVTRRRALLSRLVDWAERMGYPWRTRGDATPGEVKNVATSQGMEKTAGWAGAVEEAAYGPASVDEAREQEVRGREPHWKGGKD